MQAQRTLEEYLYQKAGAPDAAAIRIKWNQRRDRYLSEVQKLYANIKAWLRPLVDDGLVNIGEGQIRLTEENLDTYDAPELNIFLSDQLIVIRPVGTNIFGSYGRVDALGTKGVISIVLTDWDTWKFSVLSRRYEGQGRWSPPYEVSEEEFKNALYMLIAD